MFSPCYQVSSRVLWEVTKRQGSHMINTCDNHLNSCSFQKRKGVSRSNDVQPGVLSGVCAAPRNSRLVLPQSTLSQTRWNSRGRPGIWVCVLHPSPTLPLLLNHTSNHSAEQRWPVCNLDASLRAHCHIYSLTQFWQSDTLNILRMVPFLFRSLWHYNYLSQNMLCLQSHSCQAIFHSIVWVI